MAQAVTLDVQQTVQVLSRLRPSRVRDMCEVQCRYSIHILTKQLSDDKQLEYYMEISWPGLIIGLLILTACIFGYIKRDALTKTVDANSSMIIGRRATEKLASDAERTKANLILPLFGGMAMGGAMIILSLAGVMK